MLIREEEVKVQVPQSSSFWASEEKGDWRTDEAEPVYWWCYCTGGWQRHGWLRGWFSVSKRFPIQSNISQAGVSLLIPVLGFVFIFWWIVLTWKHMLLSYLYNVCLIWCCRYPEGPLSSRALSHDSIFLADQVQSSQPTRVLSQENVHSKIKALQVS